MNIDTFLANTIPTLATYDKFMNPVERASHTNIPRGCCTSYVYGLNDQTK